MTDETKAATPAEPGEPDPVHEHRPRLIPLWVAGVVGLGVVLVLLVVLVLVKSAFSDDASSSRTVEKEVVDQTGIATTTDDVDHPPQRDIRIGTCESDGQSGVRAAGTITNWTSSPSDYRVIVSFRNDEDGSEFASTSLTVDDVISHRTSNWSASVPSRPDVVFTCRIVSIDRWDAGTRPAN